MFEDERTARNRKAWEGVPSAVAMRQGSLWPEHVASLPNQRHSIGLAVIDPPVNTGIG